MRRDGDGLLHEARTKALHSQDVDAHRTAGGGEHDATVDVVVAIGDTLSGREDQDRRHRPDGHDV